MSKKEIIILIIVFLTITVISTISIYFIINNNPSNNVNNSTIKNALKVGQYSLKYGTYKGIENEYNYDNDTIEKKELTLILSKNKINGEIYEVKGMSLYVNGYAMYRVIADNKIELLAGEGVELEYEGK